MKKNLTFGEQEIEILRYVGEHSPISVRGVAEHFEKEKGLARTTVLTVMERLRKKGALGRRQEGGVFKYSAKIKPTEALNSKISDFIEKTLGGRVGPLFNYFISTSKLTDKEIDELKELALKLQDGKGS